VFPQGPIADVLEDDQAVIPPVEEPEEPHQVQVLNFLERLKLSPDFICQVLAVYLL
jgi:hypothetical protein